MKEYSTKSLLNAVAQAIYDKKGVNILALDIHHISSLTDFVLIAEGNIDRHVKALSNYIQDTLHEMGHDPFLVEGQQVGDWIVLDYSSFIIHLFVPDLREKYALEELWNKAKIVDLTIKLHALPKIDDEV